MGLLGRQMEIVLKKYLHFSTVSCIGNRWLCNPKKMLKNLLIHWRNVHPSTQTIPKSLKYSFQSSHCFWSGEILSEIITVLVVALTLYVCSGPVYILSNTMIIIIMQSY